MIYPVRATHRTVKSITAVLAAALLSGTVPVWAQADYPARPVAIIVPLGNGGVVDVAARLFAQDWSKRLGQPFVVENKPGAGGLLGMRQVKNAAPDGYTLLLHSNGVTMVQTMQKTPDVDIRRDFAPISLALRGDLGVWVNSAVPANSMKELLDYARRNPGKLNYGSSGIGGAIHLPTEAVLAKAGVSMVHVPYGGGLPMVNALIAGDIQVLLTDIGTLYRRKSDKVKFFAIAAKERSPLFPDAPTLPEVGVDFTTPFWMGLFAPAATSPVVLAKLNAVVRDSLQTPEIQAFIRTQTWVPMGTTLDATRREMAQEVDQWTATVRGANIPLND
jgi:tripartite-type tricarboxylate transporter receptor subunit TctC